ncbi:putative amidohydrolase [Fluviicoccus keumensis]|uniref:Putative amidohydrolase n=1 Tax=Fluviicoccus keumensis TaxID=1435465 RepID=A0A4Q7ZAY5_9GAMM|nr:nitrilase-related carbon-nitrogen hydrolase [Fluviicoccus keumensis]RZU47271.1 putative amidohydrolase [Fluviicoccus keumensis]
MRLALVSLDAVWEDKARNLEACRAYAAQAAADGCRFVVFPEMTLTGFSVANPGLAEPDGPDAPSLLAFRQLARAQAIGIAFGLIVRREDRLYNRLQVLDAAGEIVGCYDKVHLFRPGAESGLFSAGERRVDAPFGEFQARLSVCYDLRFPEVYDTRKTEAGLLLNIASWPAARSAHWLRLLAARAIEQRAYAVGVNRTGEDGNGWSYVECSAVFDPDGERVEPVRRDRALAVYELDPQVVIRARAQFDPRQDRCETVCRRWSEEKGT